VAPKDHDSAAFMESLRSAEWLHQIRRFARNRVETGEWNTMRIKVVVPKSTTWLNGTEMTTSTDSTDRGSQRQKSLFQIHDGGVSKFNGEPGDKRALISGINKKTR